MDIDHVHFYVPDAERSRDWFARMMGFRVIGQRRDCHTRTEILQTGTITVLISSPRTLESTVATYLQQHPPGLADLAFRVQDLDAVLRRHPQIKILQPLRADRHQATIQGWGSLRHTLIQSPAKPFTLPDKIPFSAQVNLDMPLFTNVDHAVLNVERHQLKEAARWYQQMLGFEIRDSFDIQTERSALCSLVLAHPEGTAQLPINEPASVRSQIQEFLDFNRGSGIQHIALRTPNITCTVKQLRQRGLIFLEIPPSYYSQLRQRSLSTLELESLEAQQILVELQQPDQALLQTFTQPIFGQPTFFFEVIERRLQAQGFGEGNFTALFEAIEREQMKRGTLA